MPAVGSTLQFPGAQDTFGGHLYGCIDYSGPASYETGGDSIDPKSFGIPNTILTLIGSADHTGGFAVLPRPLNDGVTSWQLIWINVDSGLQVPADFDLSGYTVRLSAIGY